MKTVKIFTLGLILVLFSSLAFSIGVYNDDNEYVYYISKANPQVEINISAGEYYLKIDKGELLMNSQSYEYDVLEKFLNPFEQKSYVFDIEQDISQDLNSRFKLFVTDDKTLSSVIPDGDPIDFFVRYDGTKPNLLKVENRINSEGKIILKFDETISSLKIYIDGTLVTTYNNIENGKIKNRYNVEIDASQFVFTNELSELKVEFSDLAENSNVHSEDIFVQGDPLIVSLVTVKEDSNLKYNFNKDYLAFFGSNIYTSQDSFELKVKTNKQSKCFFSSGLTMFKTFEEFASKEEFTTTDFLNHKFNVDSLDEKIWIACQNKNNPLEIVYLSESMGLENNLINIIKYEGAPLEITLFEPVNLITNVPFSIYVDTNENSICFYQLDSSQSVEVPSTNFKNHEKHEVSASTGNHNLKVECLDVLNGKATQTNSLRVDPNAGIQVTQYSPKYTMSPNVLVEFSLSDSNNVNCAYSNVQVSKTRFATLPAINSSAVVKSFALTSLVEGNNSVYLYCEKNSEITENKMEIIYDTKGIILSNFTFVNGNYKGDFLGSTDKVKFDIGVESLIPVQRYFAQIVIGNETVDKNFSSSNAEFSGDFSNASRLIVTAINTIGVNTTVSKDIKFDLTGPQITFSSESNGKKIVCSDLESGCSDVFYGFSQTNLDCKANTGYNNEVLNIDGNNYLCVNAFNFAGLKSFEIETIDVVTTIEESSENATIDDEDVPIEEEEPVYEEDPFNVSQPVQPDSGNGVLIVSAIVLIIASVGGGGYYAYSKGYLDNELDKLGIKFIPKKKKSGQIIPAQKVTFSTKPMIKESMKTTGQEKSSKSYDDHLNKLNKFIDSKIKKSSDVFDEFKQTHKGKEGHKSATIKGDEEFDEFYTKSSSSDLNVKKSLEEEAENFEEYYKTKKRKEKNEPKTN